MNNTKQLPRLMVFSAVATHKSFTQAAKYLNISKSAVSQQITLLESEMDTRLLNRTTRGLSLTSIGEKVLKRCLILEDQVDLLFNDIEEAGEIPKGRFSITYPYSLQTTVILPAIEQLCIEFPGLEPELIADDNTRDLIFNKIDVAIHIGELPDSSYRALPVGNLTELFCATPLYLNKNPEILSSTDLCSHKWIASNWQSADMKITNLGNNKTEHISLNQFAKTNTLLTTVAMTLNHMGIALIPDILAKPLIDSGDLVHIAKNISGPQWPIYTLHAYQNEKPIYLTHFHQLICRFIDGI
jgi:DNA-binding transcriptional LysR family regulator